MESKIVRLLQPGTKLFATNEDDLEVEGIVEAYRFVRYTDDDRQKQSLDDLLAKAGWTDAERSSAIEAVFSFNTSYDIEYRVKWSDGAYEYIPWQECDEYSPVRPPRPAPPQHYTQTHQQREMITTSR